MDNFISQEKVLYELSKTQADKRFETNYDFAILYDNILHIPTVDVAEVVRCKDCKLMNHDEYGYWCINDYQVCLNPEKDYCSRAVRRIENG